MSRKKWEKLLSGTDVRGKAIADNNKKANLTEKEAAAIASSFSKWLAERLNKKTENLKIAVGHDSRLSAEKLKNALAAGMNSTGVEVYSAGLASTPAMFMSTLL